MVRSHLVTALALVASMAGFGCSGSPEGPSSPAPETPAPSSPPPVGEAPAPAPEDAALAALTAELNAVVTPHLNAGGEKDKPYGMILRVEAPTASSTFAFGSLSPTEAQPPTGEEAWVLGSVSKVLTGFFVSLEVDGGQLNLDAPLQTYLPAGFTVPGANGTEPMTLAHLLTHTAGLPRYPGKLDTGMTGARSLRDLAEVWRTYSRDDLRADLGAVQLKDAPGTEFVYSDFGFALAQLALEQVTTQPYATLLKDRLAPLGVTTTLAGPDLLALSPAPPVMPGYQSNSPQAIPVLDSPVFTGDGFVYSTAKDMGRLLRFFARLDGAPSPVYERALTAMEAPRFAHRGPKGAQVDQGLGIGILPAGAVTDVPVFKKNGLSGGTSTCLVYDPTHHLAVAMGANGAPVSDALNQACCDAFARVAAASGVNVNSQACLTPF